MGEVKVAEQLECLTCNPVALSWRPALMASWIFQQLGHLILWSIFKAICWFCTADLQHMYQDGSYEKNLLEKHY